MLTNIFYLSPTREKKGPVNEDQLKAANISPDTLVWMPGLSAWTPAKQVPQIAALLPQPEPAPAPAPAPKPAPVQPQVVITQPVQPQVAKPQPVQPQVVNTQPVQPQVVNTQPVQPQVVNTQPINVQPVEDNYSVERPQEAAVERVPFNAAGMTGMVLALLSLINWFPVIGFVATWLVGLIFSIVGLCRPKKGMAITGLIISLIILIIVIAIIVSGPRWFVRMFR